MALSDRFKDLDPILASALSEVSDGLRQEFDQKLSATRAELGLEAVSEASVETPGEEAPITAAVATILDPIEELKHAVVAIDTAGSQGEILDRLVAGCARFASRCAVFLIREGQVAGWTSHGFGLDDDGMREVRFAVEPGSAWQLLGEGAVALEATDCGPICDKLGAEAPSMGLLVPFVLNNQTAAGVYCDRIGDDDPPNVAALQLVTFVASQVLENLPVRDRASTSTLSLAGTADGATAVEEPPAVVELEPTPVDEHAAEIVETDELTAPAEEAVPPGIAEPSAIDEGYEIAAAPVEDSTDALFGGDAGAEPEPVYEPEPVVELEPTYQPEPTYEPEPTPIDEEPTAPEFLAEPTDALEPETTPEAEPEPTPLGDEPAPDAILSDATTQVVPPTDLEGPGWAFTGTAASAPETGDEAQHEEARRLARLLVTEVKLYNEELVEQGRQKGDVYSVLKEDINRSRQIFEDRIAEDVRSHSDYFHEALVRILAGGDPTVLGAA